MIFDVEVERLLSGELSVNNILRGTMKKLKFYVCPNCGNLITAMTVSFCVSNIPSGIFR